MLIAVAGLSGAGKTTAVEHLRSRGVGQLVYVGAYVQTELQNRGLTTTPENEQLVRQSLRETRGPDVFAKMVMKDLRGRAESETILLDAICVKEECDFYRSSSSLSVVVIGINASFEARAERLAIRGSRPLTADQLRQRDRFECENLRLEDVLATADHRLTNEASLEAFKRMLDTLTAQW
jgi:dephospho-CoA kinase